MNIAEQQSKLVVDYITGRYSPPDEQTLREHIVADDKFYLSKYYQSPRRTIQLDFYHYKARLEKEIEAGRKRRRKGVTAAFPSAAMREAALA